MTGAVGAGAKFFSRISDVSLAGRLGDVRLGRDYTPTFINRALYDPFGVCCTAITRTLVNSLEFGRGSNVRADNSISINSAPAATGLRWPAMASASEEINNRKYTGARIGHVMAPFAIDLAAAKFTDSTIGDLKVFNAGASFKMGNWTFSGVVDFARSVTAGKNDGYELAVNCVYDVTEFRASFSPVVRKSAAGVKTSTVSLAPGLRMYRGRCDASWDVVRQRWLDKQKALGLVPGPTRLAARDDSVPPPGQPARRAQGAVHAPDGNLRRHARGRPVAVWSALCVGAAGPRTPGGRMSEVKEEPSDSQRADRRRGSEPGHKPSVATTATSPNQTAVLWDQMPIRVSPA